MTDEHSRASAAPGWYPDGTAPGALRWWDGSRWTEHAHDLASASTGGYGQTSPVGYGAQPAATTLPPGTSPYTVFVWILALLPIVSAVTLFTWDMTGYVNAMMQNATAGRSTGRLGSSTVLSALGPGYFITVLISWLAYFATALLAYFDYATLRRRGYWRRFHWAWSFLGGIVYLIGRPVVLRSQGKGGFAALWVYIALSAFILIITLVKVFSALSAALPSMTTGS